MASSNVDGDRFEVLEKIGQGSFGIIRKVRRKSDGMIMCRKEISYARMSSKEREQLQAELQILKGLRHQNIVAYYEREHIKTTGDLHIYMEFCEQGDLGMRIKELKRSGQMASEDFVWSVFAQLVTALYRCHYGEDPPEASGNMLGLASDAKPGRIAHGGRGNAMILHRDLKPENIFLGADASVKLGDFGLSKIMASHDFASTYVGTPFYMSPEICAAEQYSLHSDIWAFGCIMYELCAKAPPFNAKTHLELIQKIRLGKVDPLSSCYSADLKDSIAKCLRVNPTTRPDTVQLLNLPMVKLKRKEQEIVNLAHSVKLREERLERKLREVEHRIRHLDIEKETTKAEIDNTLRREWEVKARLEIDRQVQIATQQLYESYENEVQRRVAEEVGRRALAEPLLARSSTPDHDKLPEKLETYGYQQSISATDESEEFPSSTDISDISLESPTMTRAQKILKRASRTPFTRAQTMFEGSPMDVHMADPSPAPIASLNLSPRQDAKHKYRPSTLSRNLFSKADPMEKNGLISEHAELIEEVDEDEDLDDVPFLPSPTRNRSTDGDPFKTLSSARPGLPRQRTVPANKLTLKPNLFNSKKENIPPQQNTSIKAQSGMTAPKSPTRRLSKLPSASNLQSMESTSPTRKMAGSFSPTKQGGAVPRPVSRKKDEAFGGSGQAANGTLQGKSLLELAGARTAVQDFAAEPKSMSSPVRNAAPVWDPEKDEMPSPFIVRGRTSNVLAPALGGPGFRHLR